MSTAEIIAVGTALWRTGRYQFHFSERVAGGARDRSPVHKSVVGDDIDDIGVAVTNAAKRTKLVLITGGLGPTVDDVTREAVARVTGNALMPLSLGPRIHQDALAINRKDRFL